MLAALVNGSPIDDPARGVSLEERGLAYGDGLFETMLLRNGSIRLLDRHLARLIDGCQRLQIAAIRVAEVRSDLDRLIDNRQDGIVKLIVTRGAGGRGYRSDGILAPTRIALLYPPAHAETDPI